LSVGASVSIALPLCKWVAVHRNSPSYKMLAVMLNRIEFV
jgi:hypothetical protein